MSSVSKTIYYIMQNIYTDFQRIAYFFDIVCLFVYSFVYLCIRKQKRYYHESQTHYRTNPEDCRRPRQGFRSKSQDWRPLVAHRRQSHRIHLWAYPRRCSYYWLCPCSCIHYVIIPRGVFDSTNSLKHVVLPETLQIIRSGAFAYLDELLDITCYAKIPPTVERSAFIGVVEGFNIFVPAESVDAYKAATGWSNFEYYIKPINY